MESSGRALGTEGLTTKQFSARSMGYSLPKGSKAEAEESLAEEHAPGGSQGLKRGWPLGTREGQPKSRSAEEGLKGEEGDVRGSSPSEGGTKVVATEPGAAPA